MAENKAMGQPSLDTLMKNMDSRYSLVVVAAKRARVITEELENSNVDDERASLKPVTLALNEIGQGKIKFRRTKQGIK